MTHPPMGEPLPIIAKCSRCGREFVYVNPNCQIDMYPPMVGNMKDKNGNWHPPCRGQIMSHLDQHVGSAPPRTHDACGKRIDGYGDPAKGEYNAFLGDDGSDIPCD